MRKRVRRAAEDSAKAHSPGTLVFSKELVNDCVRYAAPLNLVYLNNPKCACTTVKHALWLASDSARGTDTFKGNVHDRTIDPFAKNVFRLSAGQRERIGHAAVFSAVRNPFARARSAYVDKVANDPGVWPFFLKRFGLKPNVGKKELSFADFLGLIAVAHDDILDGHFRPQCRNLLLPLAQPVFVGFVENMRPVGEFLAQRGIPFRDERMNATKAQEQLDAFYDSRTAALVRKRYAEDFAHFGYSRRLADARAPAKADELSMGSGRGDSLLSWLSTGNQPPSIAREAKSWFATFSRTQDREKKLRIARRAFATEHNWSRLERYAKFVRRKSRDRSLGDAIYERMESLRRGYANAVSDPNLFVALR